MPYIRPSLAEIAEQTSNDFQTRLGTKTKPYRFSILGIMSKVIAGVAHLIYGNNEWITKQIILDTAEKDFLERHALNYGIQRKQPNRAEGYVIFSGNEGAQVQVGLKVQTTDSKVYLILENKRIEVGKKELRVKVQSQIAGLSMNLNPGESLALLSPVANLQKDCVVDEFGINDGIDPETDDFLRDRILQRLRNAPCAGNKNDYENWCKETPDVSVTRAWCFSEWLGRGNVGVSFVCDKNADIRPNPDEIKAVNNYISSQMPDDVRLFVFPIKDKIINFIIEGPKTESEKKMIDEDIINILKDKFTQLFIDVGSPYSGIRYQDKDNYNVIKVSDIVEALYTLKSEIKINLRLVSPSEDVILAWEDNIIDGNKFLCPTVAVVGGIEIR